VRCGGVASTYAEELLAIVRALGRSPGPALAVLALGLARRSDFESRMLAILDPHLSRRALDRRGALLLGVLTALLIVPLAAFRLVPRQDAPSTPRHASTPAPVPAGALASAGHRTTPRRTPAEAQLTKAQLPEARLAAPRGPAGVAPEPLVSSEEISEQPSAIAQGPAAGPASSAPWSVTPAVPDSGIRAIYVMVQETPEWEKGLDTQKSASREKALPVDASHVRKQGSVKDNANLTDSLAKKVRYTYTLHILHKGSAQGRQFDLILAWDGNGKDSIPSPAKLRELLEAPELIELLRHFTPKQT
jgi:hypothetical protein